MHLDLAGASLEQFITHHIGNKHKEEPILLTDALNALPEGETERHLLTYFLSQFKTEGFYNFAHEVELDMHEVYTLVSKMFVNTNCLAAESQHLAKLLYSYSNHPNIKPGELTIAHFENVVFGDEMVDAIGIFKSETNVPFLQMQHQVDNYAINHQLGFELKGIDKACLILNTNKEDGYTVLVIDNANKSAEAQYWVNDFLRVVPSSDGYNLTKQFLSLTKNFVTKELTAGGEVSKTDQIDMLNRTMDYFKTNEAFDKEDFEQVVFQDEEVISAFHAYNEGADTKVSFDISNQAVKQQSRVYKSVLKLDKNFHVYIHGNKELIERGTDPDGRKYYKIYYETES